MRIGNGVAILATEMREVLKKSSKISQGTQPYVFKGLPMQLAAERGVVYQFGTAQLETTSWELRVRGDLVSVDLKALQVLGVLLQAGGDLVTKEEVLVAVWPGRVVTESSITRAIGALRDALDDRAKQIIQTRHGLGYSIGIPVQIVSSHRVAPKLDFKAGDSVPGRSNWTLVREIAIGGFGEVWLCRQNKSGEERVLKFGITQEELTGLKREVTISRLLHSDNQSQPGFVRVIDWNFDSVPFFIESEFSGQALSDWAKEGGLKPLSSTSRIELFLQVCESLAQAHSLGILHKDLKPANILIADSSTGPRARLSDFGSGAILHTDRLDQLGITRLGFTQTSSSSSTGTPTYLAPEVLQGQLPSIQSDIYALGVLLYQFAVADFEAVLAPGWESRVEDPLLRQDIAQAAHLDAARRFTSVQQLAESLRRLEQRRQVTLEQQQRDNLLLQAQRTTERARARRPWLIAASVALITGMAVSWTFFVKARDAAMEAEKQLASATTINRFLNDGLYSAANPGIGGKKDISLKAATDQASNLIELRFKQQPELELGLRATLVSLYSSLDDLPTAEQHARRGVELSRALHGLGSAQYFEAQLGLAEVLATADQRNEAQSIADEVVRGISDYPESNPLASRAQLLIGTLRYRSTEWKEAEAHLKKANRLAEQSVPPLAMATRQRIRSLLMALALNSRRYAEAEVTIREQLADLSASVGDSHYLTLMARYYLAVAQHYQGRLDSAKVEFESAVDGLKNSLGPTHRNVLMARMSQMDLTTDLGQIDQAADGYGEIYRQFVSAGAEHSYPAITALEKRGSLQCSSRRFKEGMELLRRARLNADHAFGAETPPGVQAAMYLVACYLDSGDFAAAEKLLQQIKPLGDQMFTEGVDQQEWIGRVTWANARLASHRGDREVAVQLYKGAFDRLSKALGDWSYDVKLLRGHLTEGR